MSPLVELPPSGKAGSLQASRPSGTVAIIGNHISLPQGVDSRDRLFEIISHKRQMSIDAVEANRYHETDMDKGRDHPWKLKNRYANCFRMDERQDFDASFFRISGKLARNIQVDQLLLLEAAYRAVEDAGITLEQLHSTATGIFAAGYTGLLCPNAPDETNMRATLMSSISDQVAYFLGTHGPSLTVETACSSSMVAMTMAVNALLTGDCDIAIVLGNQSFGHKDFQLSLQACGVLVDGPTCHPFAQNGNKGYMRCEGFGAFVLKRTADAVDAGDRILAEVLAAVAGSAGAAKGATEGAGRVYEQPCATGMTEMFLRALKKGRVSPADVDYLECHATGTAVGDVIELDAIGSVYGDAKPADQPLRVASVKGNIGHAEMAAGIFSVAKVLAMFQKRRFLPSAGVETPLENFDWSSHHMILAQEVEPFPMDKRVVAAVNSFGIGGSYGHIILREWEPSSRPKTVWPIRLPVADSAPSPRLLLLSASSLNHLRAYCRSIADHLRQRPIMTDRELIDLCGTAALHRSTFPFRKAFVTTGVEDLKSQLELFADQGKVEPVGDTTCVRVATVLTGQGSQYARNGADLMDAFPVYRQTAEAVDKLFIALSGWSILKKIATIETEEMTETREAQPITFLVEVALLETLKHFGVTPDLVIGHSAGETAAAYAVGLLTLEEAVKVVYHRSMEQQKLAGSGRMMAIGMSVDQIEPFLDKCSGLEVACINSPQSIVLAGPQKELDKLKLLLPSSTSATFLRGSIPFHSSYTQPAYASLHAALTRALGPRPIPSPLLPLISTVTGQPLTGPCDATYLCDNMRQPVLFQAAIVQMASFDPLPTVVLEVGPHRTLVSPVQQTLQSLGCVDMHVLAVQDRKQPGPTTFLQALSKLFEAGAALDLDQYFRQQLGYKFDDSMPGHPFLRTQKVCHLVPGLLREANLSTFASGPVAAQKRLFGSTWAVEVCDRTAAWLKHHKMGGEVVAPGVFYTEMVLEAASGPDHATWPLTLVNVEYKAKLPIPRTSAGGDFAAYVHLTFSDASTEGNTRAFTIQSCPSRWAPHESPMMLTHCTGHVMTSSGVPLLSSDGIITDAPVPIAHGAMARLPHLRDIGPEGLQALRDRHTCVENDSKESFYAAHVVEGVSEHTGPFQMITGLYLDHANSTVLGRLEGDSTQWAAEGGVYPVELLDAMTHVCFFEAESHVIGYAGGYRAGHFLRRPTTKTMWCLLLIDEEMVQVGPSKTIGDLLLYDDDGQLLVYIHGFQMIFVLMPDPFKLCTTAWQPAGLLSDVSTHTAEFKRALAAAPMDGWSHARNRGLNAWLAKQLVEAGMSSVATAAGPVKLSTLMDEEGQEDAGEAVAALATLGGAAERVFGQRQALVDALVRKLKGDQPRLISTGVQREPEGENQLPPNELTISAKELHELWTIASLQASEAQAQAEAIVALAAREMDKLRADGTDKTLVLRVLEVAHAPLPSVAERLSECALPAGVTVEHFVACHDADMLRALASNFDRRNKAFRLRRLLLPSGCPVAALHGLLQDVTFNFLLLDDWVASGAGMWLRDTQTAASTVLETLKPHLAPNAHVSVRGFTPPPVWLEFVSLLSSAALITTADQGMLMGDWLHVLKQAEGETLLLGTADPEVGETLASRVLVVASSQQQAAEVEHALQESADDGAALSVDLLLINDDTSVEDIMAVLQSALVLEEEDQEDENCDLSSHGDGVMMPVTPLGKLGSAKTSTIVTASGSEDSSVTLSNELTRRASCRVGGIVFAAAMDDDSVIGDKGFSRLIRLSQALQQCGDLLASHQDKRGGEAPYLWVLTRGMYGGPQLCPQQGSVQGLSTVLHSELPMVVTKLVDMPDSSGAVEPRVLQTAMRLVLNRAREQCYRVDEAGGLLVPRMAALDRQEMRSMTVLPDAETNFYVDTLAGTKKLQRSKPRALGELTVHIRLRDLPALGDDEVLVDVHAAALNFRDMMMALNMLPEKSYERSFFGKNFGLEAAGVIKAVGKAVDPEHLKVGDRVMMSEPASFTNRLIAPASRVMKLWDGLSIVDAASTQSVYNTCHQALVTLARVRKGEKVLIHAAAGGVGHAAISICQHVGCEIYATAGSDEKRQLLRDMGIRYVYDSRSTSWFAGVMRDTDGEGVDVVLNSLAGEHQRLGVQALRSSGRFCEVGKVDIYANQSLGLMAFRKNVSFFAIDMDRLALDDPAMTKQVCQEVAEAFAKGHYHCLPVSTFPMADIKKALGLMRAGKHVGKVVLLNYDEQGAPLPCPVERPLRVMRNGATYLLTGSNGGFATRLAIYAMQQGVRHFILANRSSDELSPMAKSLSEDLGVRYTMVKADTSIEADVLRLLEVARAHDPPITTIVHCVGVSGDVKVCDFKDGEDFDKVANGKALGAWYLSKHSEDMALENFVVVSSIASLIGGMGNAAYSAANAYLDALIRYRRAKGLPGTTFNMGSVSDAGILVKNIAARRFQRKLGLEFLTANKAIEELELGLHANASQVVTMFFKQQTRQMFPSQAAWSHLHDEPITLGVSAVTGAMSVKEIAAHLAEEIKAITQASEVLPTSSLVNLGLDSFGFIELSGRIQRTFGIDINSLKLSPEQTLQAVAATIHKLQRRGQDGAANADGQGAAQEAQGGATIKVLERGISVGAMMASPSEAGQKKGTASLQSLLSARPAWSVRSSAQGSAYLLFGATGMVGCHILRDLLEDKARRGPVYCVVFRAVTPEAALQRVVGRMKQLFIWKPEYADAFVALPGDMTKDVWFDLPAPVYERLVVEVGCVIHAACPRKWGAVESGHGDTQTTGVSNVIAFAQRSQAVLHYLSTAWLDILDVVNKEEREMVLTSVAYVAHKRRAEDMLDYACKTTGIQAVAYRQSLISASSKGAFFGDLVLLDNVRVMYALGMITSQSSTFMAIPADAMASWVAAKVLRRRSSTNKVNRLKVRTSTPLAHAIRVKDLCDVAEKLRRKPIDRTATTEQLAAALPQIDGVSLLNDDMTRLAVLMEGSGKELEAKLRKRQGAGGRASQVKLAIMRKLGKTRGQARGQGRSALDYLADYIHANPEVVTESRLVRLIQEWNSQQKRSGENIRELTTSQ